MRAGLIESDGLDWFCLAERIISIPLEDASGEKRESPEAGGAEKFVSLTPKQARTCL